MSAVRIRIGGHWHEGGVWITGEPGADQSLHTSASAPGWSAQQHMRMQSGPDWPAQRPMDLRQRGVVMSFGFTRDFGDPASMASWHADALSLSPSFPYQDDVIIRWQHHDGIGYTESRLPWAALRFDSIQHDGPSTLRILCSVFAGEMQDSAVYAPPHLLTEAGGPLLTEDGIPIRLETDDYWLALSPDHDALITEDGAVILTETGEPLRLEGPIPI